MNARVALGATGVCLLVMGLSRRAFAAVAADSYDADNRGPHPKAVRITASDGGKMITVRLDGPDKAARIHRARLYAYRGAVSEPNDLLSASGPLTGSSAPMPPPERPPD